MFSNKNTFNQTIIHYYVGKFFIGYVLMAATSNGFCWVEMSDSKDQLLKNLERKFPGQSFQRISRDQNKYFKKLIDYLEGKSKWSKMPFDVKGTEFKKRVWESMQNIPEGRVLFYGDIAKKVGNSKAHRAVASACATNPVPLVVPCHRVVPKSGGIGKYGPGVDKKNQLLVKEKYLPKSKK